MTVLWVVSNLDAVSRGDSVRPSIYLDEVAAKRAISGDFALSRVESPSRPYGREVIPGRTLWLIYKPLFQDLHCDPDGTRLGAFTDTYSNRRSAMAAQCTQKVCEYTYELQWRQFGLGIALFDEEDEFGSGCTPELALVPASIRRNRHHV